MNLATQNEITFENIKRSVRIEDVAVWLGIKFSKRGNDSVAKCPYPDHAEKTGSFTIGGKKRDKFYCFGCGRHGDIFDLCSIVQGLDKRESLMWIAERAGYAVNTEKKNSSPDVLPAAFNVPPQAASRNIESVEAETDYFDQQLYDEIYRALLEELSLDSFGRREIVRRGLDADRMFAAGYRNLPSEAEFRISLATKLAEKFKLGEDRRVSGFFRVAQNKWTFSGNRDGERKVYINWNNSRLTFQVPALIFPSRSREGKIQSVKLRNPDFPYEKIGLSSQVVKQWKSSSDPRFDNLSEALKYYPPKYQVVSSGGRYWGCAARLSPHYSALAEFNFDKLVLTEGELKSDVVASLLNFPVAALAGVNLHQDKFLSQVAGYEIEQLQPDPSTAQPNMKCLAELYEQTSFNYKARNFRELSRKLPSKSILFAFDRDNSKAVQHSLNKFKLYKEVLGEKFGYSFYFLFWNESDAKGFDDLLLADQIFSCLPFNDIWENKV